MENKRDRHFTEEEIKDKIVQSAEGMEVPDSCLLYTSPSPRDGATSRMPSSA